MRRLATVVVLIMTVSLGSTGCSTVSDHEKTGIVTGAGSAGAGLISRNT